MIKLANYGDLPRLMEIFDSAKRFMHGAGNPTQWAGAYPDYDTLAGDISRGELFAIIDDARKILGAFALIGGAEPSYERIYEGTWKSERPYATLHRVAGDGTRRGILFESVTFARQKFDHLRIDTHEDNSPMRRAILRCGFEYRGIIRLPDGAPRVAYEWEQI